MAKTVDERQRSVAERAAEFQIRLEQVLARAGDERRGPEASLHLHPFVTFSRQAASGGAEVARRLGERLGWRVLDRELVEELAARLEVSPAMLELLDETRSNWLSETLFALVNSRLVLQDSYVALLGRIVLATAADGPSVIVGRGANFLLPPGGGLRVRTVASEERRIQWLVEREGLDRRTAERRLHEVETSRAEFIRRHFHADPGDPSHFDLVVDVGSFGVEGATDVIEVALARRIGSDLRR